jgi:hypothetical protein
MLTAEPTKSLALRCKTTDSPFQRTAGQNKLLGGILHTNPVQFSESARNSAGIEGAISESERFGSSGSGVEHS